MGRRRRAKVEKEKEESRDEGETNLGEEDSMEVGGEDSLQSGHPSARKQWTTLVNSEGVSFANNVLATSKLTQPKKQVECAVCHAKMSRKDYQMKHLLKHNFMCWMVGEVAMPLDDINVMCVVLNRGKRVYPKFTFKCEKCGEFKKSTKGFLSHLQICGKSSKERDELKVKCEECGRVMMPVSLEVHMSTHKHQLDVAASLLPAHSQRRAASLCLSKFKSEVKTEEEFEGVVCPECNHPCRTERILRKHMKVAHAEWTAESEAPSENCGGGAVYQDRRGPFNAYTALRTTLEMVKRNRSLEALYPDWLGKSRQTERGVDHLPSQTTSVRVSVQPLSWLRLTLFQALTFQDGMVLYCGGPVWSLAWCPRSSDYQEEYLAVSTHPSMSSQYTLATTHQHNNVVQLWSLGDISNQSEEMGSARCVYCVCHKYGTVWSMEWLPSGGELPERIGLLALATSAGVVPIYAMPAPHTITSTQHGVALLEMDPVVVLELPGSERPQCTRIAWSKVKPHSLVVCGFSNGLVGLWDLNSQSKLLKRADSNSLLPYNIFQAHSAVITGLSLSPDSEDWLVSSGLDRCTKHWSLRDTNSPQNVLRKGLVTASAWLHNPLSSFSGYDDAYVIGNCTVAITCFRNVGVQSQTMIATMNSTVWSMAANDWINSIAVSYDNGQVVLLYGFADDRKRTYRVVMSSCLVELESPGFSEEDDMTDYHGIANKHGISLHLNTKLSESGEMPKVEEALSMYPINSANKVCWSPNERSYLWLAAAYQSGFILISKLRETAGYKQY